MKVSLLGRAIKAQQDELSPAELHFAIDECLRQRAFFLHIATSDTGDNTRKDARVFAREIDKYLMVFLERLPEYAVGYPSFLFTDGTGKANLRLQWVKGENAKYVPLADFKAADFVYEPTSRRSRLSNEMSKSAEILAQIKAYEGLTEVEPTAS